MMYCAACKNFPMLMRPCRMPTPTLDMLLLDRFLLCCLIVIRPLRTVPSVLESFLCRTITGEDPRLPFQKLCVFGSVRTVRSRFFTPMLGFCPTLDLSAAIFTLRPVYWFLLARTSISFRYSNGALLILVNSNTALSSKGANKSWKKWCLIISLVQIYKSTCYLHNLISILLPFKSVYLPEEGRFILHATYGLFGGRSPPIEVLWRYLPNCWCVFSEVCSLPTVKLCTSGSTESKNERFLFWRMDKKSSEIN